MLRCASRGLQHSLLARVRRRNRATALALSREEVHHARLRRGSAPRRAGCSRPIPFERPLRQREASLLRYKAELPRSHVPAAASIRQPACVCAHTRSRHCARSISGGGAASTLSARARRAALVVVGPGPMEGHCTSEKPVFLCVQGIGDTRLCCPRTRPACMCARERPPRALSVGRRRSTCACCARVLRCASLSSPSHSKRSPHKRRGLSRSVQDSGPTCRPWPRPWPAYLRVCAHSSEPPCSLSVGRRRSTRARHMRAARRAGWNSPPDSRRPPR